MVPQEIGGCGGLGLAIRSQYDVFVVAQDKTPSDLRWRTNRLRQRLVSPELSAGLSIPVIVVGLGGGLIGAAYLAALHLVTELIGPGDRPSWHQGLILVVVGAAITLLTKVLGPSGNVELLVDNIHVLGGAEDTRMVRSVIPTSLLCVGAGGTMGPEAPLVQTNGTLGSWVAGRYGLDPADVRVLTITGMAAGFSVLFGAPLGAALFALEILHRRGLQYYEALVPAIIGALAGHAVYFAASGLGLRPVWTLPPVGSLSGADLGWGIICGLLGGVGALAFGRLVNMAKRVTSGISPIWLPALGGAALGALAWWSPFALTNGEFQVEEIVAGGLTAGALAVAMVAKLAGVLVTLTAQWKGGFIIPLFFIGIAGGQLIGELVPSANVTVVMVGLAVGLCVGVTKTPLGSTLVVTQMAGLTLAPTALIAATLALVLTNRDAVIESQRPRVDLSTT